MKSAHDLTGKRETLRAEVEEEVEPQLSCRSTKRPPEAEERNHEPRFDELKAIQVKEFVSESRYHELDERWGHVFKAGMGAEAILEIVKRMDLDEMARNLRREIRSTRLQAAAQKSDQAAARRRGAAPVRAIGRNGWS